MTPEQKARREWIRSFVQPEKSAKYYGENKETINKKMAEYRANGKTILVDRKARLKRHYKLTIKEWEALFDKQGRCCAVCGTEKPDHKNGWFVDHCHRTNRVRGIVCHRCNITVAHIENGVPLDRLVAYLGIPSVPPAPIL